MEDLSTVDVVEGETELHEPVHDLCLGEGLFFLLLFLDVVGEVTIVTELHYDYKDALLNKRMLVRHYIWVIKFPQKFSLNDDDVS